MAVLDYGPNISGIARAYCELLQLLDRPGAVVQMDDKLTEIFGGSTSYRIFAQADFPCTWGFAWRGARMLLFLSGIRTARHFALLANSYINPGRPLQAIGLNTQIRDWATNLGTRFPPTLGTTGTDLTVIGHSLGGAIAASFVYAGPALPNVTSTTVCTFGAPKFVGRLAPEWSGVRYSRWTNPEDNVPSLPPLSTEAPLLYGLLTRQQRDNLASWAQPQRACNVTSTGTLSLIDDPPSKAITVTTLLAALQSPQGAFGPGHDLAVYQTNLSRARSTYVEPSTTPTAPAGPGTVQPPPIPPIGVTPRFPPAAVPAATLDARVNVFRESAIVNDSASVNLPFPNQLGRVRRGRVWSVTWLNYEICTCPTKKKAVALCRHMNRFLRIYQGVGQSNSPDFVFALADYLGYASDPDSGYKPLLNDGGNPPNIKMY